MKIPEITRPQAIVMQKAYKKVGNRDVQPSSKNILDELKDAYGEKELKKIGAVECATCANRTYVDGSDDPGVSFKTPGSIDPKVSAPMVMAHEMEHVRNEQADATAEDREVISQSVVLNSAICPECGVSYVAGGETRTVTAEKKEYDIPEVLLEGLKYDKKI